ncbi:MAG TPA: ATP-binding protein [Bryobacteraceae bacterium]|nr:ATP-binding protein [Bryobacteraceae bacterium]
MTSSERGHQVTADFLSGGGEMGGRIRAFDWSTHPLGPPENWPQSLKTAVSIILNSQHPMWIGWGAEISFLYNDAYLHVLGLEKHPWALGHPAAEVWAEIWDVCGPLAQRVFDHGEATFVDDVQLFMKRGGSLEETYYSFSYSPIRNESGKVAGLFCPSNDVSPKVIGARRLHTLSALAANALVERSVEAACAAAMETIGRNTADIPFALLYLCGPDGAEASLQQTPSPLGEALAPSVIHLGPAAEPGIWPVPDVLATGKSRRVNVRQFRSLPHGLAGQPVAEALVLPVIARNAESPLGILIAGVNPARPLDADYRTFFELVAGNIATAIQNGRAAEDERRRADALAEIDRAKTIFFSNVSHEFRTPLTLMLGPLEDMLKDAESLTPPQRERADIAHRNSLRLLRLVNSLLDFSRIESGRVQASYAPTDLCALTTDLASSFRSAMEAAGLRLIMYCESLPQPVYIDGEMWEKIVLNLLSNAFKFTFEGSVTVRLRSAPECAVLTVADTGTGIPESELPRIFERFHRVEGAKSRTYEGTGIGLALTEELVALHGGKIEVSSRPGEGTQFTVSIPWGRSHLPDAHVAVAPAPSGISPRARAWTSEAITWFSGDLTAPAALPQSASAPGARVLLADDNADMREYVSRILSPHYQVITVPDGRAALEQARRARPDLILSDIMMPRLDGFGLLNALRADPATLNVPVILLSARAGEEARNEGMQAGADDYLVKPFSARELIARVGAHLRLARARQEANEQSARLLESITDGFFALDRDWRFTWVNTQGERLMQFGKDEMLGRRFQDLFPDAAGTIADRELARVMTDRVVAEFEDYYASWAQWFHVKAYPAADGGISVFFEDITVRKRAEAARDALEQRERIAHAEAEALNEVARALGMELDQQKLIQTVTDIATRMIHAKFGAFFYNVVDQNGESYMLYTLSGASCADFDKFGMMPRNTPIFGPTFAGSGVRRSDDIRKEPDYGKMAPHYGMPKGHLPVRSYLAVPVKSRDGEVLGGLLFGHPEPGVFTEGDERLAMGIAAHAAIAIDNARLFQKAEQELARRRKAEEVLRTSEERLTLAIEGAGLGTWDVDLATGSATWSRRHFELLGLPPEPEQPVTMDLWWGRVHPDDLARLEEEIRRARHTGDRYVSEHRIIRADNGEVRVLSEFGVFVRDRNGRPYRFVGISLDITDRIRQGEASLLLASIVDSSDDAIVSKDLNGVVTSWNKGAERLFGYTAGEAIGRNIVDLVIPQDRRDEETNILLRLARGESVDHVETLRRHKNGRLLDVSLTISPLRDANGRITGASKITRDIGERKRTERLEHEQTRILEMIASAKPMADCLVALTDAVDRLRPGAHAAVLTVSPDGRIAGTFGAHIPESFGHALRDMPVGDLPVSAGNAVCCEDPATAPGWSEKFRGVCSEHQIHSCDAAAVSVAGRTAALVFVCFSGVRQPSAWDMRLTKFCARTAGIAIERERVAAALRESEEQFRQLAEVGPQIIWLNGPNGGLEFVNQRWIEFSGLDYQATKDPTQLLPRLHPDDRMLEEWRKCVDTGTPFEIEARIRGKDGEFRWFMIRSIPVRDEHGRIQRWFGSSTDIHQNKIMQLELARANQDLEQFAWSASHDLQEPLRTVKIFSELLSRRHAAQLQGEALDFLRNVSDSATRMEGLVRDLLAYTQMNTVGEQPELTDSHEVLRAALANLASAIHETNATIEHGPLPSVPVHPAQLQQLFQNLIGNAIKYHRPGIPPVVAVTAVRQKGDWLFSVADNGIGIEPRYRERIFGLFKRLHGHNEYPGTGIGLALCLRIVERHHGRIWVESEAGQGSTFRFTLPAGN